MNNENTFLAILLALALGTLGWFSTQQIAHGKQHTGYVEVAK